MNEAVHGDMGQQRAPQQPPDERTTYDYDGIVLTVILELRSDRPSESLELTRRIEEDKHISLSKAEQPVWIVLSEESRVAEVTLSKDGAWVVTPIQSIVPFRVTRSFPGALNAVAEGLRRLAHKQTGAPMLGLHHRR